MTTFRSAFFLTAGICLCSLAGCGTPEVKLVPATGTVTINGRPAEGVMVQFMPNVVDETIKAPTSQGVSGEGGKYELFTLDNQPGAVPGRHRVSLFDTLESRGAQGAKGGRPSRLDANFASGGLEVTLVEGEETPIEATGPGKK